MRVPGKEDIFCQEMNIKVFKKCGRLTMFEELFTLKAIPLFHACLAEEPIVCRVENSAHSVREERQVILLNWGVSD